MSGNCAASALTGSPLPPRGIGEIVDQDRAGDLHLDRPGECPLRHAVACAGIERKHRVVAGGAGVEQVGGAEVGLVARHRHSVGRAVRAGFEIARGIERQQHRHGAASDPGKDRRRDRVQLHQRGRRTRIPRRHPALAGEREIGRRSPAGCRSRSGAGRAPRAIRRGWPRSKASGTLPRKRRSPGQKANKKLPANARASGQPSLLNASPPGACLRNPVRRA